MLIGLCGASACARSPSAAPAETADADCALSDTAPCSGITDAVAVDVQADEALVVDAHLGLDEGIPDAAPDEQAPIDTVDGTAVADDAVDLDAVATDGTVDGWLCVGKSYLSPVKLAECATAADCPAKADSEANCVDAACVYAPYCDPSVGPMEYCIDNKSCTENLCVPSTTPGKFVCAHKCFPGCNCWTNLDCSDDDVCTDDTCVMVDGCETCLNIPKLGCCRWDSECGDGDPCTADYCDYAVHACKHVGNCCAP